MNTLNNKIALVTGGSKGIGAAIAKGLGAEGGSVIVNYANSRSGAEKTVAAIVAAGGKAKAVQGDFSKEEDVVRVYGVVREMYGRLDVLVNNAGVYAYGPSSR